MCPYELITGITALAAVIAEGRSEEEIELISAVLSQLGDTLATISVQKAFCEKQSQQSLV